MIKIGFIGFGKHACRLVEIINKLNLGALYKIYNHRVGYEKCAENSENVFDICDLYDCDVVFVCGPNSTHYQYLKILFEQYRGYVFCEKPPVTESSQLDLLRNATAKIKDRVYFNFNYRFSPFMEALTEDSENYNLGRLVNATIVQGHGLALKDDYSSNWRSDKKLHKNGIFENFSIHYIDLFTTLYGKAINHSNHMVSRSPNGDSIDNSCFSAVFSGGEMLTVTSSYTCPKISLVNFVFENGVIEFRADLSQRNSYNQTHQLKTIYAPRNVFDSKGLFSEPPIVHQEKFEFDVHQKTLENSVAFFFKKVMKKESFDKSLFDSSVLTNELLFD